MTRVLQYRLPGKHEESRTGPPGSGTWDARALLEYVAQFASEGDTHISLCVATSQLQQLIDRYPSHRSAVHALRRQLRSVGDRLADAGWLVGYFGKDILAVRATHTAEECSGIDNLILRSDCCPAGVLPGLEKLDSWLQNILETTSGWALGCLAVTPQTHPELFAQVCRELQISAYALTSAAKHVRNDPLYTGPRAGRSILDHVLRGQSMAMRERVSVVASLLTTPPLAASSEPLYLYAKQPEELLHDTHFLSVASEYELTLDEVIEGRASSLFVMTDVHDIEHGVPLAPSASMVSSSAHPSDAPQLRSMGTYGLLAQLVNEFVVLEFRDIDSFIDAAYARRQQAAAWLSEFFSNLQRGEPRSRFFVAMGDGLIGLVPRDVDLAHMFKRASDSVGRLITSGAGATAIQHGDDMLQLERRASFSLHVTKMFKGTGRDNEYAHEYGRNSCPTTKPT